MDYSGFPGDRAGSRKEVELPATGSGLFTYIKVDDIEELYEAASGNREFVLSDPDGYKLAFFEKK